MDIKRNNNKITVVKELSQEKSAILQYRGVRVAYLPCLVKESQAQ